MYVILSVIRKWIYITTGVTYILVECDHRPSHAINMIKMLQCHFRMQPNQPSAAWRLWLETIADCADVRLSVRIKLHRSQPSTLVVVPLQLKGLLWLKRCSATRLYQCIVWMPAKLHTVSNIQKWFCEWALFTQRECFSNNVYADFWFLQAYRFQSEFMNNVKTFVLV